MFEILCDNLLKTTNKTSEDLEAISTFGRPHLIDREFLRIWLELYDNFVEFLYTSLLMHSIFIFSPTLNGLQLEVYYAYRESNGILYRVGT